MRGLGPRRLPAFSIGLALDALPDDAQRNLALRWRPRPGLRLGVVWLGLVDLNLEGEASSAGFGASLSLSAAGSPRSRRSSAIRS